MKCIKCDKCGRVIPAPDECGCAWFSIRDSEGLPADDRDLCSECTLKFLKWLESKNE